ncbi:MAG: hypothetical protein PSX36_02720 [bacterium]|nr:hypothetical protein [bacterium]
MNYLIRNKIPLLFALLIVMIACGPTTVLTRTWTDPSVTAATFKPFTKVLVMARLKEETGNRIAEDKLVKQFKPGVALASYAFLLPSDTLQRAVDARLKKEGFDGLVLMRLKNVEQSVTVQNSGYGGYYGNRYSSTNVYVDNNYLVETCIFSLETGKMLWSGTTSSMNPSSLETTLDEIIAADKAQLIKQGLIKQ